MAIEVVGEWARPTSRETVTRSVAGDWVAANCVETTVLDLSKTLQQLMSDIFDFRCARYRPPLSRHALMVLTAAGVSAEEFRSARMFGVSSDLPPVYARMFFQVGLVLAPLAAAVQMARSPVADMARDLSERRGTVTLPRRELRGFVVACVRPHASKIHERVGVGRTAQQYLALMLTDGSRLAADVLDAAIAKRAHAERLSPRAAERLAQCHAAHSVNLSSVARQYGRHAEDVVSATWAKLAEAFRINPELTVTRQYLRRVMKNTANSHFEKLVARSDHERTVLGDIEGGAVSVEDVRAIDIVDELVRHILSTIDFLRRRGGVNDALAADTLARHFLVDPQVVNPRRARLAREALHAPDRQDPGVYLGSQLDRIATAVTGERAVARSVVTLALGALAVRQ